MGGRHALESYVDDAIDSATLGPLTDADAGALTWHRAHVTSVAGASYSTVFDLTGAVDLVGGSLHGHSPGFRLTIDGTEVVDETGFAQARDSNTDAFGVVSVPHAKATSSMKLEIYNASSSARDYGWGVATR